MMIEELDTGYPDGPADGFSVFVLVLVLPLLDFTSVPVDLVGYGLFDWPVPIIEDLVEYGLVE